MLAMNLYMAYMEPNRMVDPYHSNKYGRSSGSEDGLMDPRQSTAIACNFLPSAGSSSRRLLKEGAVPELNHQTEKAVGDPAPSGHE